MMLTAYLFYSFFGYLLGQRTVFVPDSKILLPRGCPNCE